MTYLTPPRVRFLFSTNRITVAEALSGTIIIPSSHTFDRGDKGKNTDSEPEISLPSSMQQLLASLLKNQRNGFAA
jgi:hypothetical protein